MSLLIVYGMNDNKDTNHKRHSKTHINFKFLFFCDHLNQSKMCLLRKYYLEEKKKPNDNEQFTIKR